MPPFDDVTDPLSVKVVAAGGVVFGGVGVAVGLVDEDPHAPIHKHIPRSAGSRFIPVLRLGCTL